MDVFERPCSTCSAEVFRDRGLIHEYKPGSGEKVFFLSHQWLSFKHPDPALHQVRASSGREWT